MKHMPGRAFLLILTLTHNPMELAKKPRNVHLPKVVEEYPLPAASQTHEMAVVKDDMLVISQQPSSSLIKVQLHYNTGRPTAAAMFTVGNSAWGGLHGLFSSKRYPGQVWATLQFECALVRLDPVAKELNSPPKILQRIQLPAVLGPHVVIEDGKDLWTTCKGSRQIVRINHTDPSDMSVYNCSSRPIFVAVHSTSGDVYASLDEGGGKIFRLHRKSGDISELDIPADKGSSPVGLIAGPDGNVWFVLLGGSTGGTGTFGRISSSGDVAWFHLPSNAGATAGLIHLAFDNNCNYVDGALRIWLLGSSLVSNNSIDAVFTVYLRGNPTRIERVQTTYLPTPYCGAHRVLPHRGGLFVTELGVSLLAHVNGTAIAAADRLPSENSDFYHLWGLGKRRSYFDYSTDQKELQHAQAPPAVSKEKTPHHHTNGSGTPASFTL